MSQADISYRGRYDKSPCLSNMGDLKQSKLWNIKEIMDEIYGIGAFKNVVGNKIMQLLPKVCSKTHWNHKEGQHEDNAKGDTSVTGKTRQHQELNVRLKSFADVLKDPSCSSTDDYIALETHAYAKSCRR